MMTNTLNTRSIAPAHAPFAAQLALLTARYLKSVFRSPAAFLPGLIISIFTLLIYQESLGNAANFLPGLAGKSYLAFILPGAVVNSALSSSGIAGQSIVRDIGSGYFDKLLLTPVSRAAILLGAMFAGALLLGLQTTLVVGFGVLLGLNPPTGVLGLAAVIGIALVVGNALAGFTVGVGLRSGNPATTQAVSFLFFPLTLLTAAFTPLELLGSNLRVIAQINPVTYVLGAMRTILIDGWGNSSVILTGVLIAAGLSAITFAFALTGLQVRTRRK